MMKRIQFALSFVFTLAISCALYGEPRSKDQDLKTIDAFVTSLKENKEASAEQIQKATEAVEAIKKEDESLAIAITEGLREIYPTYREALQSVGEENLAAAAKTLQGLTTSNDPFLAADASYFLARVYLLEERYEDSLPLLESLEAKFATQTNRAGEGLFLKGVAEAQMLRRKDAMTSLQRYIAENPDAPERMKIGAWRQLEILKRVEEGTLSDVQLRMDFSRRRLSLEDTGDNTRVEQQKIISMLDKLIKDAEEQECNCKGKGQGKGQGKKQGKPGEGEGEGEGQPGEGKQGGKNGGGSKGIDSSSAERLQRGGPQSPWSQLREKERDPVFNAIKDKFPGRYQQLIEQYYKSFQEGEEN